MNRRGQSTQDDVIVYDRPLVPPVLVSPNHAPEGVFLFKSVLARIEVKSTLTRSDVVAFVRASMEIAAVRHSVQPGFAGSLEGAFNPLDLTKVSFYKDYPLIEVGVLELNRNPENYFAEVEQSAFNLANIVPGISFSPDKMLQGRLFSYGDAQRGQCLTVRHLPSLFT